MAKSVFITGTKSGIGLEFVRQFAISDDSPKYIFASGRNPKQAEELNALANKHKNVYLIDLDVANDQQIEAAVKLVASYVGEDGLNLLINNAGLFDEARLPHISREVINRHFDVNATSPLLLIQAFLPLLKKAAEKQPAAEMSISKAAVINITSEMGSLNATIKMSPNIVGHFGYGSSKAALNLLTKHLSFDLKNDGVLVVAITPGFVDTPLVKSVQASVKRAATESLQDDPIPLAATPKMQTPEESITLVMATMRRLTDKHNGGYFRRNGEKVEDFDFAPATD